MPIDTYTLSASERLLRYEPTDGRVSCVVDRWKLFPSSLRILFASGKVVSQTANRTIVEYEVGSHQSVVSILSHEVVEFRSQAVAEIKRLNECLVVCRKVVQRIGVTGAINSSQVLGIYPDGVATRRSRGDVENQILLLETLCLSLQRVLRGEDSSIRVALGEQPCFVRWGIENSPMEKVGIRIIPPSRMAGPSIPEKIDVLPTPLEKEEIDAEVKVPKEKPSHKPSPDEQSEIEEPFVIEPEDVEVFAVEESEVDETEQFDEIVLIEDDFPYVLQLNPVDLDEPVVEDDVVLPAKVPTWIEEVLGLEWLHCCLGAILALIFITLVVSLLFLWPWDSQPSGGTSEATSHDGDPRNSTTAPTSVASPVLGSEAIALPTAAVVGPSNSQRISPVSPPSTGNPQTATPPSGPTAPATSSRIDPAQPDKDWKQVLVATKKSSIVFIATHDGSGSGFFISAEGLVVTNAHVVGTERHVMIFLDGLTRAYKGEVKKTLGDGDGRGIDLALIQVLDSNGAPLRQREFLRRGTPQIGEDVIALGFPWSPGDQERTEKPTITMTEGSLSREVMKHDIQHWDHSARLLPGNSGGPLLDRQGRVVAINVAYAMGGNYTREIPVFLAIDAKYIDQLIRP